MPQAPAIVVAVALTSLALMACEGPGAPSSPDPVGIALQANDLPNGLQRCRASGTVAGYAGQLDSRSQAARDELATTWRDLQQQGADKAALTVYATQPEACAARLGTGNGVSVASLVAHFPDERKAVAAYRRGFLGFSTPSEDEVVEDMSRGAATGLGRHAWMLERTVAGRDLTVALWERHSVVVLFLAVDEDPLHARQALSAIDRRIP